MRRFVYICILQVFIALCSAQKDKVCKKDNGLFPHEQYCDYYYECEDGVAALQLCPNGLAFSGKSRGLISNCDYPYRVNCPSENDQRVLGQTPQTVGNCQWLYGIFAHQTSCTRYWQCWNGTATVQQCPFSLLFNDDLHSCDWPDNVADCQKHPICKDIPNGRIPIANACVRYWLCVGGYPRLQRCAAGLAFNPTALRCELADHVAGCEPPSTTAPVEDDERDRDRDRDSRPAPPPRQSPRPQPTRQVRPVPVAVPIQIDNADQSLNDDQPATQAQPPRRLNTRPVQRG